MSWGSDLVRVNGILTKNGLSYIIIREVRYSVGLKTTWELDFPVFCLVTMTDSARGQLQELQQLGDINEWDAAGIHPSVQAMGVAAFSFRIRSLLRHWVAQWSRLIDAIRRLLDADVS